MSQSIPHPRDKWIPWYFVLFFLVVASLDAVFVTVALRTHTGLVTEQAYEKGLAYNDTLEQARSQPPIQQAASFQDGRIRWRLRDESGNLLERPDVKVRIVRPVKASMDFERILTHVGNGVYEAALDLPAPGYWQARLEVKWDNRQYRTVLDFTAP
jgi:nitrogen fixation protein FixH